MREDQRPEIAPLPRCLVKAGRFIEKPSGQRLHRCRAASQRGWLPARRWLAPRTTSNGDIEFVPPKPEQPTPGLVVCALGCYDRHWQSMPGAHDYIISYHTVFSLNKERSGRLSNTWIPESPTIFPPHVAVHPHGEWTTIIPTHHHHHHLTTTTTQSLIPPCLQFASPPWWCPSWRCQQPGGSPLRCR